MFLNRACTLLALLVEAAKGAAADLLSPRHLRNDGAEKDEGDPVVKAAQAAHATIKNRKLNRKFIPKLDPREEGAPKVLQDKPRANAADALVETPKHGVGKETDTGILRQRKLTHCDACQTCYTIGVCANDLACCDNAGVTVSGVPCTQGCGNAAINCDGYGYSWAIVGCDSGPADCASQASVDALQASVNNLATAVQTIAEGCGSSSSEDDGEFE